MTYVVCLAFSDPFSDRCLIAVWKEAIPIAYNLNFLEPANARKSRQKVLSERKNGNRKKGGQLRKLCPRHGVLPRPIVSEPRKEYLCDFSRAVFSTSWYFRVNPKNGVWGRFVGALRPHAALYSRLPVARILGHYGLVMCLSCSSRYPQYSHSNHVSTARPRSSFGSHLIGVQSPHLAHNASGSSGAGVRRTFGGGGMGAGHAFCDTA